MSERKQIVWRSKNDGEEEQEREFNWDEPLPTSSSSAGEEEQEFTDEIEQRENLARLDTYVARMAYIPAPPPPPPKHLKRTEQLAKYKKLTITDNYRDFGEIFEPSERGERIKALAGAFQTMQPERFEEIHKVESMKKRKKENLAKRKQELFYELASKLESQCRSQYLNVLKTKFADFVAEMATTMNIPPQLNEPYARMQRGIFCNILGALGLQPLSQSAYYYNTQDALEFETIHKCAHALLCLIIRALDNAANKNPNDIPPMDREPEMDTYIKERLMTAAMRKLVRKHPVKQPMKTCLENLLTKCDKFAGNDPCQKYNFR